MGATFTDPATSITLASSVSINCTFIASASPVLVISIVYMMVPPGLTVALWLRLSVLVAVNMAANGLTALAGRTPASGVASRPMPGFNVELKRGPLLASILPLDDEAAIPCGSGFAASARETSADGESTNNPELDNTLKQLLTAIRASEAPMRYLTMTGRFFLTVYSL